MTTRWKAVDGFAVHVYDSGDLHVLYHEGSGDTHMLDDAGMAVFRQIDGQGAAWPELLEFVDERLDGAISAEALQEMLDSLARAGVINRIDT